MRSFSKLIPSRRWLFVPPLAIGVAVVAILNGSKKDLARVDPQELAKPLKVVRVKSQGVPAEAIGYGTAKPLRLWSAISEVGGRIVETHPNLRSGIAVKRGELLVLIDPADYQLRVQQRAAELAQAKAQLEQLKLTQVSDQRSLVIQQDLLAVRQDEVDRLQELRNRSAASQSEADSARAAVLQQSQTVQTLNNTLTTYPAQIASAEAAVSLATARLGEADRDVERTKIVAPFDGLLSDVTLEPDQYVAPNQHLFQMYDSEFVEVEAQFSIAQVGRVLDPGRMSSPEEMTNPKGDLVAIAEGGSMADQYLQPNPDVSRAARGLSATVTARSGDKTMQYTGQPVRVDESLDEQTRTLGIVVRVDNRISTSGADFMLRPGSYCEVTLTANQPTMAHLVPRSSVAADSVLIVDRDNRLRRRGVRVAFPLRQHIAVVGGLLDGDLVVINRPAVAIEGELIEPQVATNSRSSLVSSLPDTTSSGVEDKK